LLIEQLLTLLSFIELIICRRIKIMLTLDEQILNKQLIPKYLPLILLIIISIDTIPDDFNNLNYPMNRTPKVNAQILQI
ncbi:unnamed protein product, partial [Rotaria sp. Silwood1]